MGGRNGELLFNGYKVSVMTDNYVLEMCGTTSAVLIVNNTVLYT